MRGNSTIMVFHEAHVMKLADWLKANSLSEAQFAERIGRSKEAVRRYATGARIPDKETMPLIAQQTQGLVQPNDFYGIAA